MTTESWRCPLCNATSDDARAHLADVHGVGGRDRFGLRDAARRKLGGPGRDGASNGAADGTDGAQTDGAQDGASADDSPPEPSTNGFGPPIWRRAVSGSSPREPRPPASSEPGLTWRRARRPARPDRFIGEPPSMAPARPVPLPPDAAVLRLICESLDGVDAMALRDRLLQLPGVDSVALDLYDRTADLYLDRNRATPAHLVAMAMERIRLKVQSAEIHRAAKPGQKLGDETRLYVVK